MSYDGTSDPSFNCVSLVCENCRTCSRFLTIYSFEISLYELRWSSLLKANFDFVSVKMGLLSHTYACGARQYRLVSTAASSGMKFETYIRERRKQAEKSLLIQVSDVDSTPDVESYLTSNFGPLDNVFHYSIPSPNKRVGSNMKTGIEYHWVLAEFSEKSDLVEALHAARFQEGTVPYQSTTCWFSQILSTSKKAAKNKPKVNVMTEQLGIQPPTIDFSKAATVSEQMRLFESRYRLSEIATRVRFIVCHNLELAVSALFPRGCILPFGSTVNGIGRTSGDLDIVLLPDKSEFFKDKLEHQQGSRLWYQSKMFATGNSSNARFQSQRVMETLADIITLFVPGCSQVTRILNARVPILRFTNDFSNLQCDLSMLNSTGVYIAELIFMMKAIDDRFAPLFFIIRQWAGDRKVVQGISPSKKPTNFMLVLLVTYYLQYKKILPTFDILFNNAAKNDIRLTQDGIDCTFLRDPGRLKTFFTPQNTELELEKLLLGFFEYYSAFDFKTKGISLFAAGSWKKPDAGPLYIQNPLERHLNVARNVGVEEINKFKSECVEATWRLEAATSSNKKTSCLEALLVPVKFDKLEKGLVMKEIFQD